MTCCQRCAGRMTWEPAEQSVTVHWRLGAWRCMNCGEWFDLEAMRNRARQRQELSTVGGRGSCAHECIS